MENNEADFQDHLGSHIRNSWNVELWTGAKIEAARSYQLRAKHWAGCVALITNSHLRNLQNHSRASNSADA